MTICINQNGDIFEELIVVAEDQVDQIKLDFPITHALVVARNADGFLLLFNNWKQHWELPGGILEPGESLQQCAMREMLEEQTKWPTEWNLTG
ncbi:NUDIX domain-containing protein [Paenibacillus mendelii]|uniref:NUDIX domain-containing protein n=1 Tax=Paenibacillus mendelii TaxID=206163 RepID=A0ABV6JDZ6_9BACL|nr:NUDIX hydrolase [Paenibacillus mendelii]MCQ6562991.1 NUDIX hydrolase [Paenibacillus mendelii]